MGEFLVTPRVLQFPPLIPHPPDADGLGVEEQQVPAVVASHLHRPAALGQVLVVLLEERPDVGGIGKTPPALLPTTRAPDYRLGAHPILQDTPLRGAKGHYETSLVKIGRASCRERV